MATTDLVTRALSDLAVLWEGSQNYEQYKWGLPHLKFPRPIAAYVAHVFVKDEHPSPSDIQSLLGGVDKVRSRQDSVLATLNLESESVRPDSRRGVVSIWATDQPFRLTVIGLASSVVWSRLVLAPLSRTARPVIMPSLTQAKFQRLLTTFETKLPQQSIRIRKASSRRWIVTGTKARRVATRLDWEDLSVQALFREAREERKWYHSVKFELVRTPPDRRPSPTGILTRISRNGYLQANRFYPELLSVLGEQLGQEGLDTFRQLSHRSRRETVGHDARPLAIVYDYPIFKDPAMNSNLIQAARRIPRYGYSVIHGNPYIHMALTDHVDGSSYELFVAEDSRALLVPQLRASAASMDRLLSGLFSRFPEGNIAEVAQTV